MLEFSLAKVTVMGRIGFIELKVISDKFSILKMSVAVDRRYKKGEEWLKETMWINCEYANPNKWVIDNVLKKQQVIVTGDLKITKAEKDGKTTSYTSVDVKTITPVKAMKEGEEGEPTPQKEGTSEDESFNDLPF